MTIITDQGRVIKLDMGTRDALIYLLEDMPEVYLTEDDPAIVAHGEKLVDLLKEIRA